MYARVACGEIWLYWQEGVCWMCKGDLSQRDTFRPVYVIGDNEDRDIAARFESDVEEIFGGRVN